MSAPASPLQAARDRDLILRFVIWSLRVGDLPDEVREAAARLSPLYRTRAGEEHPALWEPWRTSS